MLVQGRHMRTLWPDAAGDAVHIIDQRLLPHRLHIARLSGVVEVCEAIREMWVRGAPLIGVTAAYGLALQARVDARDEALETATQALAATRPTAINLAWALRRMRRAMAGLPVAERAACAWAEAAAMAEEDVAVNTAIGQHGLALLKALAQRKPGPLRVLTHCNAGWLATIDRGTALSPLFEAQAAGLELFVWVDETRPRNQGASLTAFELAEQGIAHRVIADNAGGHLMQHGQVDAVIVGCDRVTARGDVCNKIGTYLKALAAHDNGVPFYVAMPSSTLDRRVDDGVREIPIEERHAREVTHLSGVAEDGRVVEVRLTPPGSGAANPAFDVTPARLVTALITEQGVLSADAQALATLETPHHE